MDTPHTDDHTRQAADSGRVAVPEIAELLHLQRPAAMVAAAVVVLLCLVLALVAPGVLPPNAVSGFVVGLLALFAGATAAVVLDGRDPVVRGPRHLRRDGHAVLARMAGPDPEEHAAPVLAALQRRMAERNHLSIAVTGTGTDPSELAAAVARGAAAAGHTSLVIDLRAAGAPGVADVGAGTVRLGEAATLADDRPYAWIGGGLDRAAAVTAAAGVARRPPRDLELLLVVAPEAATHTPELLRACDRTLLLVAADTQQRAMVSARLDALERAGGTPEAVVVGGLQVGTVAAATAPASRPAARGIGAAFGAAGAERPAAALPPLEVEEERPAPFAETPAAPDVSPPTAPEPPVSTPPAPPVEPVSQDPVPPPPPPVMEDVGPAYEEDDVDVFAPTGADDVAMSAPDDLDEREDLDEGDDAASDDETLDDLVASIELAALDDEPEPDAAEGGEPAAADDGVDTHQIDLTGMDDTPDASDAPQDDRPAVASATDERATDPDATGPLRPISFRTTTGDLDLDGFAESDPLVTTAALEQLLRRQDGEG